ncbi:MAG TPA: ATP-binding protein [Bacteroidetes bacterium]|nr:ATP-binding protein [Bacteroidota bacterium]
MNHQTTLEQMKSMRLNAMAEAHYNHLQGRINTEYTTDQYVSMLIEREWETKQNNKINRLIKNARFRFSASIQDIDYTTNRQLNRNVFERLAVLDFIRNKENIIITGATGTGKSYLAQALGNQACQFLFKTLYYNTSRLMEDLKIARLEGTYTKALLKIERVDLLILDDFGLVPLDTQQRQALLDIIEGRYDRRSTIMSSQIPVSQWHELIGEGTIADAILDRIVHSSHRIELIGDSMRKKQLKKERN